MAAYLIKTAEHGSVVVHAATEADALAVAKGDYQGTAWDHAEVSEVVPASDARGFTLHVAVTDPESKDYPKPVVDVRIVGGDGASLDSLASEAAKALNDTDEVNGAAYNAESNVLTVAGPAGGDKLGHCKLHVAVFPRGVAAHVAAPLPGAVLSVVDGGAKDEALRVVFPASYSLPCRYDV